PKPSRSHKNGVGIDFRYLRKDKSGDPVLIYDSAFDIDRQNDLNGALNKFGFDYQLSEHFASPMLDEYEGRNISVDAAQEILDSGLSSHKLDNTSHYDESRHHNHLHVGGVSSRTGKERFNPNIVERKKETP